MPGCTALDFIQAHAAGGDIGALAAQVCGAIAWIYKNAESLTGIPNASMSAAILQVSPLRRRGGNRLAQRFGIPDTAVKGGLCMSCLYF
jgi:hypothetical protein